MFSEWGAWLGSLQLNWLTLPWAALVQVVDSNFFSALMGALIGAIAASWIANKNKQSDDIVREIRSLKSALIITMSVINSAGSTKKQMVRPLKSEYDKCLEEVNALIEQMKLTGSRKPINVKFDFKTLPTIDMDISPLYDIVFKELSSPGMPIAYLYGLTEALNSYNNTVQKRNQMIGDVRSGNMTPGFKIEDIYLALKTPRGQNDEYKNLMQALEHYNNDTLFFSKKLAEKLHELASKVIENNKTLVKEQKLSIPTMDFSEAIADKLFPDEKEYESWSKGFQERKPVAPVRWLLLKPWHWFKRQNSE